MILKRSYLNDFAAHNARRLRLRRWKVYLILHQLRFLEVYQEASDIYGLLHARFIYTIKGSNIMRERFL